MDHVDADAEGVLTIPVTLSAPVDVRGRQPVEFLVVAQDGSARAVVKSNFFGPTP